MSTVQFDDQFEALRNAVDEPLATLVHDVAILEPGFHPVWDWRTSDNAGAFVGGLRRLLLEIGSIATKAEDMQKQHLLDSVTDLQEKVDKKAMSIGEPLLSIERADALVAAATEAATEIQAIKEILAKGHNSEKKIAAVAEQVGKLDEVLERSKAALDKAETLPKAAQGVLEQLGQAATRQDLEVGSQRVLATMTEVNPFADLGLAALRAKVEEVQSSAAEVERFERLVQLMHQRQSAVEARLDELQPLVPDPHFRLQVCVTYADDGAQEAAEEIAQRANERPFMEATAKRWSGEFGIGPHVVLLVQDSAEGSEPAPDRALLEEITHCGVNHVVWTSVVRTKRPSAVGPFSFPKGAMSGFGLGTSAPTEFAVQLVFDSVSFHEQAEEANTKAWATLVSQLKPLADDLARRREFRADSAAFSRFTAPTGESRYVALAHDEAVLLERLREAFGRPMRVSPDDPAQVLELEEKGTR